MVMTVLLDDIGEECLNGKIVIFGFGLFGLFLHVGIFLPFHLFQFRIKRWDHLVDGLFLLGIGILLHF